MSFLAFIFCESSTDNLFGMDNKSHESQIMVNDKALKGMITDKCLHHSTSIDIQVKAV